MLAKVEAVFRKKLHSYIDAADVKFLKMVYAMSKEYDEPGKSIITRKIDRVKEEVLKLL